MNTDVEQHWISGFWRRIVALVVDTLILGVFGFLLGLALESVFVEMGAWGRLVGFAIALVYFGIGNSAITGGQTLGKKVLKLRVVNSENAPVGIGRSLIRYIILATPFSLNGAQFSPEAMESVLMYPISLILFGGMFSIIYLYVFNRISRQSLHDLAVGTFVVNSGVSKQEVAKVWRGHIVVVVLLFVAAAAVPAVTTQLAQSEPFTEMFGVQSALMREPDVSYATISQSTTSFSSLKEDTKTTDYVSSQVFLKRNTITDDELARHLAGIVVTNYPEALNTDTVRITLTYGYDIGIASQWSSHHYNFSPDDIQSVQ